MGDVFSDKGDNSELCKDRLDKVKGTITELFALSKGIKFGIKQIESLLLLYKTVFLPRLIYNCESENPEIITVKLLEEDIGSLKGSAHCCTLP